MSMTISERLKAEHGVFLYQLDRLEELALANTPMEVLAAVVETIASAEDHHAMIEDRVLYPALVQANGGEFTLRADVQLGRRPPPRGGGTAAALGGPRLIPPARVLTSRADRGEAGTSRLCSSSPSRLPCERALAC